jgi:Phosphodiester glycosidase
MSPLSRLTVFILLGLWSACTSSSPSSPDSSTVVDAGDAQVSPDGGTGDGGTGDAGLTDAQTNDSGTPTGIQPMPIPSFPSGDQTVYTPFLGVRVVHRTTDQPRPLSYLIVLIDPDEPGIDFRLTPPNDPDPRETTRQTTTAFVEQTGAQLAINAHFFAPWPPVDAYANLGGLAVSQGNAYSPFDATYDVGIAFESDNTPVLVHPAEPANPGLDMTPPVAAKEAVGAREQIVTAGANTGVWTDLHPRTVLGIASNGEIVIGVVDGRQDGRSEGMGTDEVAEILIADFGVTDAINLDGGGSTTLAIADLDARLLNVAVGAGVPLTERQVGSNLAVFAQRPPAPMLPPDLVAYEPFDHPHHPWGVDADTTPLGGGLSNLGGGTGWASSWLDDFASTRLYGIATYPADVTGGRPTPLGYVDGAGRILETAGGQARACYGSDCAAVRPIDTNRVAQSWLTAAREIGADGTEVWVSFLAQSETGDDGARWAYVTLGDALRLGRISEGGGFWGLQDARSDSLTMSTLSAASVVFFVARIRFLAGSDHVDAWMNPPLDASPATPTLSMDLPSFTFRSVGLEGRYSTDFDEIRIGRSYAAVTPTL